MNSDELCIFAENNNIDVMYALMPKCVSVSAQAPSGNEYIAIDERNMPETQLCAHLAHEIGHCMTGTFYNPCTPLETRARCEHKANVWAIKKFLPREAMEEAMKNGAVEVWQLAEHFGVMEKLVRFACRYYFNKEA